jgi:hypothetical protein
MFNHEMQLEASCNLAPPSEVQHCICQYPALTDMAAGEAGYLEKAVEFALPCFLCLGHEQSCHIEGRSLAIGLDGRGGRACGAITSC